VKTCTKVKQMLTIFKAYKHLQL